MWTRCEHHACDSAHLLNVPGVSTSSELLRKLLLDDVYNLINSAPFYSYAWHGTAPELLHLHCSPSVRVSKRRSFISSLFCLRCRKALCRSCGEVRSISHVSGCCVIQSSSSTLKTTAKTPFHRGQWEFIDLRTAQPSVLLELVRDWFCNTWPLIQCACIPARRRQYLCLQTRALFPFLLPSLVFVWL